MVSSPFTLQDILNISNCIGNVDNLKTTGPFKCMQERAHCLCERSLRICWTLWHRLLPSLWLPRFSYCPVPVTCLSMLALKSHIMFWVLLSCKRCPRSRVKHGSVPSFILRASRGCRVGVFPRASYFVCSFMFSHLMEKASVSVLPQHDSK